MRLLACAFHKGHHARDHGGGGHNSGFSKNGLAGAGPLFGETPKEAPMQILIKIRSVSMDFMPVLLFVGRPAGRRGS